MRFLVLCLCVAAAAAAVSESETLIGWSDFHLKKQDSAAAEAVRQFAEENGCLVARENHLEQPEDIIVPPQQVSAFEQLLQQHSVEFEVPDSDVGSLLLKERMENLQQSYRRNSDAAEFFAQSSQIASWLSSLTAGKSFAKIVNIGKSYEGRNLQVLQLSTNFNAKKPVIFVDSAIHAREWLAPATLNHIVRTFVQNWDRADVKALRDKFDWHFMNVVNPDGYDYTFRSSSTRFWRKTRHPYRSYYGADPNRNFDYQFGGPSTSNNPASDLYHGPRPFSEPETRAMSNYLKSIQSELVRGMYVSFHTYGQLWLTPPGYTRRNPVDHAEMMRVANIGNNAIRSTSGISFRVGQPANVGLYEAAGGSYDWVKYVLGVKYSYTLELRPRWPAGIGGFVAKLEDIPKSGKEIYEALRAIALIL